MYLLLINVFYGPNLLNTYIPFLNLLLYCLYLGGKTPDVGSRTYSQIMQEQKLKGEENEVRKTIIDKSKDGSLKTNGDSKGTVRKRGRWDQVVQNGDSSGVPAKKKSNSAPWEEVIIVNLMRIIIYILYKISIHFF